MSTATNRDGSRTNTMPGGWNSPPPQSNSSSQNPPGVDGGNVMAGNPNINGNKKGKGKAVGGGDGANDSQSSWNARPAPDLSWGDPSFACNSNGAFGDDTSDEEDNNQRW